MPLRCWFQPSFPLIRYRLGFLLKIGRFRTLRNSPQIFTKHPQSSWKTICKHIGDVSGSWERFPAFTKSVISKTMGILLKIGRSDLRNSAQIFTNNPESSCKSICKHMGGVSGTLEQFPALSQIGSAFAMISQDTRYGVNSQDHEIGRFWAKSLGYSLWFWTWQILVSAGNRSKLPEMPPTCFQIYF